MKIKIYADGANEKEILFFNKKSNISGLTTNPSLMRKSGISNYKNWSKAIQITKNSDDASDILQDTFLKVYDSIHTFRHGSAFETWLYRIVVNLSIDTVNGRKRRQKSLISFLEKTDISQKIEEQLAFGYGFATV